MKKSILAIVLMLKVSAAFADMQPVTDVEEATAIRNAFVIAYNSFEKSHGGNIPCTKPNGDWTYESPSPADFVKRASQVFRDDSGQPVLMISYQINSQYLYQFTITTDSSGTNIQSLRITKYNMGVVTTENHGTLAHPQLVQVPAKWELSTDLKCN